jgi:hypothetical protein
MTPTTPNRPTNYNTYLPLTGNKSTSSESSDKPAMDKTNTGQPPTAAPKRSVKTTKTPGKTKMTKQQMPPRSSQRALAQGFTSYPGLMHQERRML